MAETQDTPTQATEEGRPSRRRRRPASPTFTVDVTAELIAQAIPKDSSHCMIADAIKAAMPHVRNVIVDIYTARFTDPRRGVRFHYLVPRTGQEALIDFDDEIVPPPFSMTFQHAVKATRTGASGGKKPLNRQPKVTDLTIKDDGTFRVSPERQKQVNKAFNDPEIALGGTVGITVPGTSAPMQVGGLPAGYGVLLGAGSKRDLHDATHSKHKAANFAKVRRFGMRQIRGGRTVAERVEAMQASSDTVA